MSERLSQLPDERSVLVAQAAEWNAVNGRRIPADYIEKDFWVTEALRSLAKPFVQEVTGEGGGDPGTLRAIIVFKGGTSLSKAYGLINRFSEDIDLFAHVTFQRMDTNGKGAVFDEVPVGSGRADKAFELLAERAGSDIGLAVVPYADKDARSGTRRAYQAYYAGGKAVVGALKPVILIELTRMGNPQPNESRVIESLVATYVREAGVQNADFAEFATFYIAVLGPHRTLVEKLCALEYTGLQVADGDREFTRMARHFYDVGSLLGSPPVVSALKADDVAAMAHDHFELSSKVRRVTGARPADGFANSSWIINSGVALKAKEAYDAEVPELTYAGHPTFEEIQNIVRDSASFL